MREHGRRGAVQSPRSTLLVLACGTALACTGIAATVALGLPGDLDPSFDGDGKLITDLGAADFATDVAIQADGKIVAVGFGSDDFSVARYNADGSLDASFDGDGLVTTGFGAIEAATSIAIQSDGKIVVAGITNAGPNPRNFALARYNDDGSLDDSFDGDGSLFTDFGADDVATDVAIQPDGKIVVAGGSGNGATNNFAFARYNTDGSPDNSFDNNGLRIFNFGGNEAAFAMALQSDGKVVAAGLTDVGGDEDFALARLDTDGTPDLGFDGDGRVITSLAGLDLAEAVAIQPDGMIVATGGTAAPGLGSDVALIRYQPDGSPDPGFDGDGVVVTDLGSFDDAQAVAIQADGKLVVAAGGFSIARYNPDGSLDSGFGTGGVARTDFGGMFDFADALAIQPDGNIVVAGTTDQGLNPENLALARFEGGEPPPPEEPPLKCKGRTATIRAVPGVVTRGTAGNDVIVGTAKRDRIKAGRGRDVVCGRRGNDRLAGGAGRDLLLGGKGRKDRCLGGPGKDRTKSC